MQEAQEFHLTAPVQSEIFKTALPAPSLSLRRVLALSRELAVFHRHNQHERGVKARALIAAIDRITHDMQEGMRS